MQVIWGNNTALEVLLMATDYEATEALDNDLVKLIRRQKQS